MNKNEQIERIAIAVSHNSALSDQATVDATVTLCRERLKISFDELHTKEALLLALRIHGRLAKKPETSALRVLNKQGDASGAVHACVETEPHHDGRAVCGVRTPGPAWNWIDSEGPVTCPCCHELLK